MWNEKLCWLRGGGRRWARAGFRRGREYWRRRQPEEDPTSWSWAVFFTHFGSFISVDSRDRGGVAMVAVVGLGEKRWAQRRFKYRWPSMWPSCCGGGAGAAAACGPRNCIGCGGGRKRRVCAGFRRGGESWRRWRPEEDPTSWPWAVFFIHFGSFIFVRWRDRDGVAMVTAVGVGEKRRA
jgi:hypothetical protein